MKVEPLQDFEDDVEKEEPGKELSLYQKLVVKGSPKNKGRALKEGKLSSMSPALIDMVN